jgi:ATP-binding cassette, subfamily F, member 3
VLLDALEDYGGTLIIVSHDRYFVEKLATKIIEIGHGEAAVYPGTYTEFLWHKEHPADQLPTPGGPTPKPLPIPNSQGHSPRPKAQSPKPKAQSPQPGGPKGPQAPADDREARKRQEAERKKQQRAAEALQKRIADLEGRIAERETRVKDLEATMSAPGFYDDRVASKLVIDQHQALMWEVGDLMAQWEALQEHAGQSES